jgi:hypothetical protein
MPISRLDDRRVTLELKLRLKFYCSQTWWVLFFQVVVCLFYYCGFLFLLFFSFYTINFTISIFSSLLSLPSVSHFLLCWSQLLSCPTTLSVSSHPLSPPPGAPPDGPPKGHQTTPTSYTLTICWPTYYTNLHNPNPCNPLHNHPKLQ